MTAGERKPSEDPYDMRGVRVTGGTIEDVPLPPTTSLDGRRGSGSFAAPSGDESSEVVAMSPDGRTVIGMSANAMNQTYRPFRWTKATGSVELPGRGLVESLILLAVNDSGVVIGKAWSTVQSPAEGK